MDEQALYRAILAAPHDDTARLVYADWLDEHADRFPEPLARSERARAEFIRVGCAVARAGPGGWNADDTPAAPDPALLARRKRLLFRCGAKWRRAVRPALASSPFDRGFLRPFRSLRPQEFLNYALPPDVPAALRLPPLPADSPARRYVPGECAFDACPLWDVHLYAPDYSGGNPYNDRGQYGHLLAEVARSPALARVGWLKVSFFHTGVFEFLRTGNFANVETLVLNCGPFPAVLDAVAGNASFRSLRYIRFGADRWAWGTTASAAYRYAVLTPKLEVANRQHLRYGEMRAVLRELLHGLPPLPRMGGAPTFTPPRESALALPGWPSQPSPLTSDQQVFRGVALTALGVILIAAVLAGLNGKLIPRAEPPARFDYNPERYKVSPSRDRPMTWPEARELLPQEWRKDNEGVQQPPVAPPEPVPPGFVGPPPEPERKK